MTESLSAFVASAVEFIIGGMMLLGALVFVTSTPQWDLSIRVTREDLRAFVDSGSGALVAIVLIGAAYAVGVIGESACRGLLEWDLRRVTALEQRFATSSEVVLSGDGEALAKERASKAPSGTSRKERTTLARVWENQRPRRNWRFGGFSRDDFEQIRKERERQRALVATEHVTLHAEVESQLRRLRLERMAFFAALIGLVGFWARGELAETLLSVAVVVGLFVLVHDRFKRFCDVIARGCELVTNRGMTLSAPGSNPTADDLNAEAE